LNVVPLPPWEREALSGHGGCYKLGGGGFFVLFCSFKISSQNQRFPNDCINSKQTNKPKTKGVFSTKPTCEAGGLAGVRVSAGCQPRGCPRPGVPAPGAAPGQGSRPRARPPKGPGKKLAAVRGAGAGRGRLGGFAGGLRS